MKTVLVCNQKGGTGKTTLADEIAFEFDRLNLKYDFYDLDGQGGCIHAGHEVEDAEYGIVDTPGALQKDMGKWMQNADLIIIPTKMTSKEIEPLERMIELVKQNNVKVPVLFVLNMKNQYSASKDFEEWFTEAHPECRTVVIPQSEIFVQAAASGMSVIDFKKSSVPAEKVKALVSIVKYELGIKN